MDKEVLQIEQQLKSAITLLQDLKTKENQKDISPLSSESKTLELYKIEFIQNFRKELIESKELMLNELKEAINNFDDKYNKIANEIVHDLDQEEEISTNKSLSRIFCQKVHKNRTSLLLRMHQNEDTRTVYHIFIAIMLVMIFGEMLSTYHTKGVIIDLSLFTYVFGEAPLVICCWL